VLQSAVYVGLSGQLSLQRRLDTIAQNVANSSTAGYRSEEIKFESIISQEAPRPVAFASHGKTFLSTRLGEVIPTGNPLDVALQGNAWLSVQAPTGPVYTRDGRFRMLPTGELQTLTGYPVLDDGGAAINLDPRGGPVEIGRNGVIRQDGRQTGRVGLFSIDPAAKLSRFDTSGVIPDRAAEPVTDFNTAGLAQGFIERSNVNPVMEITHLISVSRAFDALNTALGDTENTIRDAITTLGSTQR
jgi:flagellar basal-body rod protein FlgF